MQVVKGQAKPLMCAPRICDVRTGTWHVARGTWHSRDAVALRHCATASHIPLSMPIRATLPQPHIHHCVCQPGLHDVVARGIYVRNTPILNAACSQVSINSKWSLSLRAATHTFIAHLVATLVTPCVAAGNSWHLRIGRNKAAPKCECCVP